MIYFIQAAQSGLVKIGKTARDVKARLRELQTGSAEKLQLLAVLDSTDEKAYHQRFQDNRVHGEWFQFSPSLRAFVAEINQSRVCALCEMAIQGEYEGWDNQDVCLICAEVTK